MSTIHDLLNQGKGYQTTAALGSIPGYEYMDKFGINPDVDTNSVPEDIWTTGGLYTGFPSGVAETVDVFSDNAADASAGTGARTIRLIGLDADHNEQTVDVTLNGTTAVATTETWSRLYRAFVVTSGSGGENAGVITARHTTTTANVFFEMQAGDNQTLVACTTVPANKRAIIKSVNLSIGSNLATGSCDVSLRTREDGGVFRTRRRYTAGTSSPIFAKFDGGIVVPQKTDIKLQVDDVSANNTGIAGEFEYYLVES